MRTGPVAARTWFIETRTNSASETGGGRRFIIPDLVLRKWRKLSTGGAAGLAAGLLRPHIDPAGLAIGFNRLDQALDPYTVSATTGCTGQVAGEGRRVGPDNPSFDGKDRSHHFGLNESDTFVAGIIPLKVRSVEQPPEREARGPEGMAFERLLANIFGEITTDLGRNAVEHHAAVDRAVLFVPVEP